MTSEVVSCNLTRNTSRPYRSNDQINKLTEDEGYTLPRDETEPFERWSAFLSKRSKIIMSQLDATMIEQ